MDNQIKMVNDMESIIDVLEREFGKYPEFLDEKGNLSKEKIKISALKMDCNLLNVLLNNAELKQAFFKDIEGVMVFDRVEFSWVLNNSEFLPDSYTSFKNKIGLTDIGKDFLATKDDVVLSFPYKDCVLVGGQTKDDEKRKECFLNETLCKKKIDVLLEPKCFTNSYRYDGKLTRNITFNNDNIIIKGNNLIALCSLLPIYQGKIQLIFIDPPYNTQNDTFNYNDSFNHSTWLTFMKNRLEVAKKLLSPNGSIYISMDYNEIHYLKVLMDEVFGRENFQREIIWRIGWLSGYKTTAKNYIRNHDTILYYTRDPNNYIFNKKYLERDTDFQERFNAATIKEIKNRLKHDNQSLTKQEIDSFVSFVSKDGLPEKYPLEDTWNCSIYDKLNSIAVVSFSGEKVSKMLGVDEIKGQKAEKLLKRIIETSTNEGDLVLDFFLGSGTTCAVAHKMKRKYIGIEQMDYITGTTCERIKTIIDGRDSCGISQEVKWTKGGSFTYCELANDNQKYIDEISKIVDSSGAVLFFDKLIDNPFVLDYEVNVDLVDTIKNRETFVKLDIDTQKKILISILDKNMLYINYSDIDDVDTALSESDKKFTKSFYKKGE